jgi:hypothetical protein
VGAGGRCIRVFVDRKVDDDDDVFFLLASSLQQDVLVVIGSFE